MNQEKIRSTSEIRLATRRATTYWAIGVGLILFYVVLRGSTWQGSAHLHTIMEAVATNLALMVGVMALVRYYSKKNNTFLFIGAAFLGTACLDGYHTVVTSEFFAPYLPSDLPSLIPWSWVASRLYLSVLLFLSYIAWRREQRLGDAGRISERSVYWFTGTLMIASFLFFAFVPLPRAYYPEIVFHRPEEFVPAILFAAALAGYLHKGEWRRDAFEHWLVLSLVVGVVSQAVFMSYSGRLFDLEFDAAHTLKKVSYICVLTGLLINMYASFRQAEESSERIRATVDTVTDAIIMIDDQGTIQSFNRAAESMFGYSAEEVAGWNVSLLMPETERIQHGRYINNYLETGKAKIIGTGRQVVGLRKDGTEFPLDLGINEMRLGGQLMFVGSCRDISEIVKANTALERHTEELARSNAELEQFAYVASHDLQEPLRKVQAFGDRMVTQYASVLDERGLDYLNRMRDAANRMQTLVENLLEFSRIASKGQSFVPVDLAQVAREVASDLEIRIQETETLLEIGDLPTIHADPLQMRQLLQNLIANALKYRRKDTSHTVRLKGGIVEDWGSYRNDTPEQFCQILVKDNGIGFEEKYAERIFGIFQRLHGRSEFEGTGVGLAICRKICERHGGTITAEGRPGDGATFIVTLPINHANSEAA